MALNEKIKVKMPEHCVKVPRNGTTYIQYTLRSYRNEKGKPTSDRIAIGKLDDETGMLIPNRNYYEIFEKTDPDSMLEIVRSNGVYLLFSKICKKIGLERLVQQLFPDNWEQILTVAQYMLSEGNVMYYLPDWQDENVSYTDERMTEQEISRLLSSIDETSRLLFFRLWMKEKYKGEYLAYDVTSISSYSKQLENLEWGYNRDKEILPQINMAMYYGEESRLPLYYRVYPGSITDKTHLRYMLEDSEMLDVKKVKYVMDRGFYSADNLRFITDQGNRFVIAIPNNLKYVRDLILKHKAELINRSECHLGIGMTYGKSYEINELGFRMRVHLYYDAQKAATECEDLYTELNKIENELSQMEEAPDKKLHYDKYFYINKAKDGSFGYIRNHKAINEALSLCGFFVISETDFQKTTAEILELYRRRDVIEKAFDNLKNSLDMHRLYAKKDEVVEGKLFCTFIALIVHSYMRNHLSGYLREHKLTFEKVLLELKKSKQMFSARYPSGFRFINPHSKLYRQIFELCDIVC